MKAKIIAVSTASRMIRARLSQLRGSALVSVVTVRPVGGAVGDGFDNARRHEGEWNEPPDVALDLVLTSGNRLE